MRRWIYLLFLCLAPALVSGSVLLADSLRHELERATTRLEKLREAYDAGAVSRKEVEEAEAEVHDVERRLREATGEPRDLNMQEAQRRVEEARVEYEKASAKAKKLRELYDAGAAARNDLEAADAAAGQAEVIFRLNEELARRVEVVANMPVRSPAEGGFTVNTFFFLQDAYFREFNQPLPVSAFGPSETHEKMGFDHEGRVDIALHPDSPEGRWLVAQLHARHVPFIAFRNAVAGKATGAHIHLGFPSPVKAIKS
jgi:hypothetical protein